MIQFQPVPDRRSDVGRAWLRFLRSREVNPARFVAQVAVESAILDCREEGYEFVRPKPPPAELPCRPALDIIAPERPSETKIRARRNAAALVHFAAALEATGVDASVFSARSCTNFDNVNQRAKVARWMNEHLCAGEPITMNAIARACGVSSGSINHLLHRRVFT